MALIDWHLQGFDVTTCNCAWGCPCQFMSLPTQGNCRATVAFQITRGHFANTRLDGLNFGGLFAWPGAIHEGHGEAQPIVDERADAAQREALLKIMSGEETEPGATIFNVFAATYEKVYPPIFTTLVVEADLDARTGRIHVDGLVDGRVEPIRNPVTGAPFHARIALPSGFEYNDCELGSSTVRTTNAPITLAWEGRHAHVAVLDMTGQGVVRPRAA